MSMRRNILYPCISFFAQSHLRAGDVSLQPDGDLPLPAHPEEGRRPRRWPRRQRHLPHHVRRSQRGRGPGILIR